MHPAAPVVLFVINPISGGKQKTDHEAAIKKYFTDLEHTVEFFVLDGKNDAPRLQQRIEKVKPQTVVAVGGDGTVTLVAKNLVGTQINLGILPAGSANGMARELNIPLNIDSALQIIHRGKAKRADVLKINNQICLHLSDIGLNAQLIKYFEEGKTRGKLGYAKVALKVLLRKQNIYVTIQSKGKEIRRRAFMVVLANASKYGTGAVINAKGNLYDGIFEVVIIKQLGLGTLLKMFLLPKKLAPHKIEILQASTVAIETHRRVHFQIDGEYLGKVKHVRAEILPSNLNILLPDV